MYNGYSMPMDINSISNEINNYNNLIRDLESKLYTPNISQQEYSRIQYELVRAKNALQQLYSAYNSISSVQYQQPYVVPRTQYQQYPQGYNQQQGNAYNSVNNFGNNPAAELSTFTNSSSFTEVDTDGVFTTAKPKVNVQKSNNTASNMESPYSVIQRQNQEIEELKIQLENLKKESKMANDISGYVSKSFNKFFSLKDYATVVYDKSGIGYLIPKEGGIIPEPKACIIEDCEARSFGVVQDKLCIPYHLSLTALRVANTIKDDQDREVDIIVLRDTLKTIRAILGSSITELELNAEEVEDINNDLTEFVEGLFKEKLPEVNKARDFTELYEIICNTFDPKVPIDGDNEDQVEKFGKIISVVLERIKKFFLDCIKDYINITVKGCLDKTNGNLVYKDLNKETCLFVDMEMKRETSNLRLDDQDLLILLEMFKFIKDFIANGIRLNKLNIDAYTGAIEPELLFNHAIYSIYVGNLKSSKIDIEVLTSGGLDNGVVTRLGNPKLFDIINSIYEDAPKIEGGIRIKKDTHIVFTDGCYTEYTYQILPRVRNNNSEVEYYLRKIYNRF